MLGVSNVFYSMVKTPGEAWGKCIGLPVSGRNYYVYNQNLCQMSIYFLCFIHEIRLGLDLTYMQIAFDGTVIYESSAYKFKYPLSLSHLYNKLIETVTIHSPVGRCIWSKNHKTSILLFK